MFEALADAGVRTAAVNFTAYRGRTKHRPTVPFLDPVLGPERFFFYNLFQSERTGAPLSFRNRAAGSIDSYAAAVGRWLVTRDGFDFLLFYLSDYDYASHASGPDTARVVLERCDDAVGGLVRAAGGLDEFLERYAVIVMSDHGQTAVADVARLGDRVAARAADRSWRRRTARRTSTAPAPDAPAARSLAERLDGEPSVEVVLFREDETLVARRDGAELRLHGGGSRVEGDPAILDHPDAVARATAALRVPQRRRRRRVCGRGMGVRGPRRAPSSRRRLAWVACRRRLARPDPRARRRGPGAGEHRRRRACRARTLRRRPRRRTRCVAPRDQVAGARLGSAPRAHGRAPAPPARDLRRARARRDGARAAGGVRAGRARAARLRRRSAPDRRGPDDLAAVHRRDDVRAPRARRRRDGPRRRDRLRVRGRGARRARGKRALDRADPRARGARQAGARADGPPRRRGARSETAATARPTARRSTRSRLPPRPTASRRRCTSSSLPVGGWCSRAAARADSGSYGSCGPRTGPSRPARSPAASCRSCDARCACASGRVDRYARPARWTKERSRPRRDLPRGRVDAALRSRANWEQLVKFCVVGATGYVVNLAVYALLLEGAGLHYVPAAIGSFLVAVTNNYVWNRVWTFRGQRGHVVFQGLRFLVVSTHRARGEPARAPRSRPGRPRRARLAGARDHARHAGQLRRQQAVVVPPPSPPLTSAA